MPRGRISGNQGQLRWVRANISEYEEVLQRFRQDVDIKKIKSRQEFQKKVSDWGNLKGKQGKRLAQAFEEILTPPPKKRRVRRVAIEEIIPKRMETPTDWQRHEVAILRFEMRRGRGYGKRVASRLEFERSLSSIYKKAHRLRHR